jgi:hypothetical protein
MSILFQISWNKKPYLLTETKKDSRMLYSPNVTWQENIIDTLLHKKKEANLNQLCKLVRLGKQLTNSTDKHITLEGRVLRFPEIHQALRMPCWTKVCLPQIINHMKTGFGGEGGIKALPHEKVSGARRSLSHDYAQSEGLPLRSWA